MDPILAKPRKLALIATTIVDENLVAIEGNGDVLLYKLKNKTWKRAKSKGQFPKKLTSPQYVVHRNSIFFYGGWKQWTLLNKMWEFNLCNYQWTVIEAKCRPSLRIGAVLFSYEDSLYLLGGMYQGQCLEDDFYRFDIHAKKWHTVDYRPKGIIDGLNFLCVVDDRRLIVFKCDSALICNLPQKDYKSRILNNLKSNSFVDLEFYFHV